MYLSLSQEQISYLIIFVRFIIVITIIINTTLLKINLKYIINLRVFAWFSCIFEPLLICYHLVLWIFLEPICWFSYPSNFCLILLSALPPQAIIQSYLWIWVFKQEWILVIISYLCDWDYCLNIWSINLWSLGLVDLTYFLLQLLWALPSLFQKIYATKYIHCYIWILTIKWFIELGFTQTLLKFGNSPQS